MKKNSKGAADASPCKKERLMILDIKEEALAAASRWQDLFYNLHRCPELGRKEQRTADAAGWRSWVSHTFPWRIPELWR